MKKNGARLYDAALMMELFGSQTETFCWNESWRRRISTYISSYESRYFTNRILNRTWNSQCFIFCKLVHCGKIWIIFCKNSPNALSKDLPEGYICVKHWLKKGLNLHFAPTDYSRFTMQPLNLSATFGWFLSNMDHCLIIKIMMWEVMSLFPTSLPGVFSSSFIVTLAHDKDPTFSFPGIIPHSIVMRCLVNTHIYSS